MKELYYLNKYFIKYKWHLLLGILFVGLSNYFQVLVPQVIRNALNFVVEKIKESESGPAEASFGQMYGGDILMFAGIVIGLSLLVGIFMYFMRKTIIVMSRLIEYDMRKELYAHYQKLDTAFFKDNKTGDLMSRLSEDVSKVRMYLGPGLLYGIRVAILFVMVIWSMFRVSTTLSLYTLLPLPFLSISIYYVSSIIHKKSDEIQRQLAKLNSIAQEVFSGIRVVKSYVKENDFSKYFEHESDYFKLKSLELAKVNALFFPLMILLMGISTLLTIYVGGILFSRGEISAGNLAEFVIYINYLTWPITSIGWIASIVKQAEASQGRINEILRTKPAIENTSDELYKIKGEIEFRNVSFTYPDTGIKAIKNLSFKISAGEKVAIVGRTASGKSTIADLLLRLYDVSSGKILIDGKDIRDHNLDVIRSQIGYVSQSLFLFSDTIGKNIQFGDHDATPEKISKYAERASIKTDILDFEKGFETLVGERGVTLSGGQKQRLSIARAFIKEPQMVILDDSLSAIDANTEHKIMGYLNEFLEDKTAVIVTHRIFSLLDFDKIIVIENGEKTEEGVHETLVRNGGYYSEIVEKQSSLH